MCVGAIAVIAAENSEVLVILMIFLIWVNKLYAIIENDNDCLKIHIWEELLGTVLFGL